MDVRQVFKSVPESSTVGAGVGELDCSFWAFATKPSENNDKAIQYKKQSFFDAILIARF
jgi:hypothetical protein